MEDKLEMLKFDLKKKTDELEKQSVDTFVLNPKVQELMVEIEFIRKQIKDLEDTN